MKAVEEFRAKALNPEHPKMRGSHENGDVFFQHREACNSAYDALPAVVEKYLAKINEKLGTNYDLFNYYGAPDADRVMIAMGSVCDVADEVIDYLNAKGEKVGIVKVRLYRPWVSSALLKVLPKTAKKVAVLDRTKEPGSLGEPLYLDVAATLREAGLNDVVLTGGRYGLGSKDTPPSSIFALFKELEKDQPKERFTLGITDDVTGLSLPEVKPAPITAAAGTKECKFGGLGGQLGANAGGIFQLVGGGLPHSTHALELCHQGLGRFGAHAGHLGQGGGIALLPHLLLAVCIGKAVGLVLDGRDKGECPPVHIDGDLPALTVHDGTGAVMVILDHAVKGHIGQRSACQCRLGRADLPPAAIHHQDVREPGKASEVLFHSLLL